MFSCVKISDTELDNMELTCNGERRALRTRSALTNVESALDEILSWGFRQCKDLVPVMKYVFTDCNILISSVPIFDIQLDNTELAYNGEKDTPKDSIIY